MESVSLPSNTGGEVNEGDFHRDVLPHLEVCLLEHGNPISKSITTISKFRLRVARFVQPTMMIIIRDQVLNAAKCGFFFAERGLFDKAVTHLQAVKEVLVQALGEDKDESTRAMLGLAAVYWGLGRLEEAIALQRAVVDTRCRILGPMNEQTLQAMDHLGRSFWLHGLYREALDIQQVTTERMRSKISPDHPLYLNALAAMDNLGVTLGAWHRYDESLEVHREVLEGRKSILGEMHLDTLTTKANFAMALLDLGHLEEARLHMTIVYEERQRQLGKEHPWTLWALCYLAKVYIEAGDLTAAEDMLVWGIEAGVRSLTETHLGVLMGRGELARVYARQGKLDEAEKLSLETVKHMETYRGIAHPDCVYGLKKLTQLYVLKQDRVRAIKTCRLGLERADMRITRTHPMGKELERMLVVLENPLSSASDLAGLIPRMKTTGSNPILEKQVAWKDGKATPRSNLIHSSRAPTW